MNFYGFVSDTGNATVYKPYLRFKAENDKAALEYASEIKKISGNYSFGVVKYRGYERKDGTLVIQENLNIMDW